MSQAHFQDPDAVAAYERGPRLFIPGYDASHDMASVLLMETMPDDGHVLVIGAGGGIEMAKFAEVGQGWSFTGVDPAQLMLDMARQRLAAMGAEERIALIEGYASDAPDGPFDAATCFLVLHFVPDDGSKLATLRDIHRRLKPGAPFVLIDGCMDRAGPDFAATLARYSAFGRFKGAPEDMIAYASSMVATSLNTVSAARQVALLTEAGFTSVEPFYRGLWVQGWLARA